MDDHGTCPHCSADMNGERIYDHFLKEYEGNREKALETASMYGAGETNGRFGREVYVKPYDKNYNKLKPYFQCPDCGGKFDSLNK